MDRSPAQGKITRNRIDALPTKVKSRIFEHVGREGNFAYQIANRSRMESNGYIQENAWHEPFTYWDWAGMTLAEWGRDDEPSFMDGTLERGPGDVGKRLDASYEDHKRKRRLFWEREKGYRANCTWSSYPSGYSRWTKFKSAINDSNRRYVKRIAVSHWMTLRDLGWIARELPELDALDLSDIEDLLTSPMCNEVTESRQRRPDWLMIAQALKTVLPNITWVGVQQEDEFRDHLRSKRNAFTEVIATCEKLRTLSIRGRSGYKSNTHFRHTGITSSTDIHRHVCEQMLEITNHVPVSVTTIELRRPVPLLKHFLVKLHQKSPAIQRVGIDLDAWIQMYPLRRTTLSLHNSEGSPLPKESQISKEIDKNAETAALHARLEAYSEAHTSFLDNSVRWLRLASDYRSRTEGCATSIDDKTILKEEEEMEKTRRDEKAEAARYRWIQDRQGYYLDRSGMIVRPIGDLQISMCNNAPDAEALPQCELDGEDEHTSTIQMVEEVKVNTLPRMLRMLFEAGNSNAIALFPLNKDLGSSADPIHPFALIQSEDEASTRASENFRELGPDSPGYIPYRWIHETFNWNPVLDWDWFMVPRNMAQDVDPAYGQLFAQGNYMSRIKFQLDLMRSSRVPVHILIGRRKVGTSSCYWGWPYDKANWQKWLAEDFDANLSEVAQYVDYLSVYYDLRNPLDEVRLDELEALESYEGPLAACPSVKCAWADDKFDTPTTRCPFIMHRQSQAHLDPTIRDTPRRMADRQALDSNKIQSASYYALPANGCDSSPPVGESATDHASDDSEMETDQIRLSSIAPLHHLSRRAAYMREAVGWHRFWATYALQFTHLTKLRLRMPRCFDKSRSWRLAKLLQREQGWEILVYADERQHVQSSVDTHRYLLNVPPHIFEHKSEVRIRPAGRFIRRSWVWPSERCIWQPQMTQKGPTQELTSSHTLGWADQKFLESDWSDTQELEQRALEQAIRRAEMATMLEQRAIEDDVRQFNKDLVIRDRKYQDKTYVSAMRKIGQHLWETHLQHEMNIIGNHIGLLSEQFQFQEGNSLAAQQAALEHEIWTSTLRSLQIRMHDDAPIFGKPLPLESLTNDDDMKAALGWIDYVKSSRGKAAAKEDVGSQDLDEWIAKKLVGSAPQKSFPLEDDNINTIVPGKRKRRDKPQGDEASNKRSRSTNLHGRGLPEVRDITGTTIVQTAVTSDAQQVILGSMERPTTHITGSTTHMIVKPNVDGRNVLDQFTEEPQLSAFPIATNYLQVLTESQEPILPPGFARNAAIGSQLERLTSDKPRERKQPTTLNELNMPNTPISKKALRAPQQQEGIVIVKKRKGASPPLNIMPVSPGDQTPPPNKRPRLMDTNTPDTIFSDGASCSDDRISEDSQDDSDGNASRRKTNAAKRPSGEQFRPSSEDDTEDDTEDDDGPRRRGNGSRAEKAKSKGWGDAGGSRRVKKRATSVRKSGDDRTSGFEESKKRSTPVRSSGGYGHSGVESGGDTRGEAVVEGEEGGKAKRQLVKPEITSPIARRTRQRLKGRK